MHGVSRPVFHHEEKAMTFEDRLDALTAAILDLTAALKAESAQQKPPVAPIETAPTPEPTPQPPAAAPSKADVQAALVEYGNAAAGCAGVGSGVGVVSMGAADGFC